VIGALASVFVEVIAPVVIIAAVGFLVGRARELDLAALTGLMVSVIVPAIVFDSLARAAVSRELLGRLGLHVVVQLPLVGALALGACRVLAWRQPTRGALLMATLFSNSGNLGLPLALFGFGPAGLAVAGSWFAVQAVTLHTLGIFIAARARTTARVALARMARLPIIYAIAAGIAVNLAGVEVPRPVARASELLASGGLALMLLLLGLQLARMSPRAEAGGATVATAIRLLAAPPIAWVTGWMIGLEGMPLGVAVLQASTPTAVTAALWAMEFDAQPALVSAAVVLSTLAGVVTITVLMAVLIGGG
jgi:predicted permease